ncbi:hypothetical protein V6N13_051290 [Hibiscus sabdariffa]
MTASEIINSYTTILETLKIYLFCRRAEEQICRAKVFVLCGSNVTEHLLCWLSKVSFMTLVHAWNGQSKLLNQNKAMRENFSFYVHASKEKPVHMSRYFLHREIRSDEVVWVIISMVDTLPEHLMAEFRHGDRVKNLKQRGKESCKKYGEHVVYRIIL